MNETAKDFARFEYRLVREIFILKRRVRLPHRVQNKISWSRAVVAYQAHNLMVGGSSPSSATNKDIQQSLSGFLRFFIKT